MGRDRRRARGHRAVLRRRDPLRARGRRAARRDRRAAPVAEAPTSCSRRLVGLLPFATTYGLIYWAEQYVTSGLTAVLFGVLPLYVALLAAVAAARLSRCGPRLRAGRRRRARRADRRVRREPRPRLGASTPRSPPLAVVLSPLGSAVGNVAIKQRGAKLDPLVMNGWAMLGRRRRAAARVRADRGLGRDRVVARVGRLDRLPRRCSAPRFTFVTLTVLLRELPTVTVSFISMIIPFGALALGALLRDERVTVLAVAGALLVVAGIAVAQLPARRRAQDRRCLRSSSSAPAISAARSSVITSTTAGAAPRWRARRRRLRPSRAAGGLPLRADAADPDALRGALEQARAELGRLDVIVNAVSAARPTKPGPFGGGALGEATVEDFRGWTGAVAEQAFVFLTEGVRAGAGTLIQVTGGSARRAMPGRGLWARRRRGDARARPRRGAGAARRRRARRAADRRRHDRLAQDRGDDRRPRRRTRAPTRPRSRAPSSTSPARARGRSRTSSS